LVTRNNPRQRWSRKHHTEGTHDEVEVAIREWQRFGVAFLKSTARSAARSEPGQ
jgi:hypothetical protein